MTFFLIVLQIHLESGFENMKIVPLYIFNIEFKYSKSRDIVQN